MSSLSRREFLRTPLVAAAIASGCGPLAGRAACEQPAQTAGKPNIVFILADDLGWAELGCYGNTFNETPNLDRLAREGMRFTQAYTAAPVCSPTRAALLTGRWPQRFGITDYLGPQDRTHFLKPEVTTLNEALQPAGYVTGLIGKWHLTGDYSLGGGAPEKHGWDEILCSERVYIGPGSYFAPYKHLPHVAAPPGEYLTDRLNREAVDFIRRHKAEPFFLYLSHFAPHTTLAGKPEKVAKYKAKPGAGPKRNNPRLAAMIESIDEGVGEILRVLDELKLAQNTIVTFYSDNGGEDRVTSNAPLRAGKSHLYEGGIRVPLVVRWPAGVARGTTCDAPVVTMDFFPTLVELAGLAPRPSLDGTSLVPLLRGRSELPPRDLVWYYPLPKPHFLGGRSAGAIRHGNFKLIEFYDTGAAELYDLAQDIGETHDLTGQMPERAAELRKRLKQWREQVPLPPAVPAG
jgi:arylsulfatase A